MIKTFKEAKYDHSIHSYEIPLDDVYDRINCDEEEGFKILRNTLKYILLIIVKMS